MNHPPVVTVTLILAICGIYALELQVGGSAFLATWGFVPAHPSAETAVSSLLFHDPSDWTHLAGNAVFLALFGTVVEGALGSLAFGVLYTAAGLGGVLAHWSLNADATTPLVGCSGALFGLLAVATVLRPRLLGFVTGYVGFTIWQLLHASAEGGVSSAAHVGGFVVGAIVAVVLHATSSEALEIA